MKKALYIITMFSLVFLNFSAVAATAGPVGSENINTSFQRSDGGGAAPIVKAKWEMLNNREMSEIENTFPLEAQNYADSRHPGAQFNPTGEWDTYKDIYVCAIATDPDGISDIDAVYADIFYPEGIALGPGHEDVGCGEQHGYEIELQALPKMDGIDLFCNNIKSNDYWLPTFNTGYDYDEICAQDGELWKETAKVYCKYTKLKWEDPAGDYRVQVHAVDNYGVDSTPLNNWFEYLPLTSFEVDFDSIDYGDVKLNTHKIINGDLTWNEQGNGPASVRNTGNTRLNMTVMQDDMGLGQTTNGSTWWNVRWDGRVGSTANFRDYDPYQTVTLQNTLELSQLEEMDFSILIKKFPLGTGNNGNYNGDMTLGARYTNFLTCQTPS